MTGDPGDVTEEIPPTVEPGSSGRGVFKAVVAAVLCGLVAGAGTWLALGALDKRGSSTEPSSALWTVDWGATYTLETTPYSPDYLDAPEVFDDGLDHANLPPLVERVSPSLPDAHELTDEIWAAAGPGWMIATYDLPWHCWYNTSIDPNNPTEPRGSVVDLVSPEGVHFRLASPQMGGYGPDWANGLVSIDYANLTEGSAIATIMPGWCSDGLPPQANVQYDLRTGEVFYAAGFDYPGDVSRWSMVAIGPLVGGAEVRLRHHGDDDLQQGDGLFVWTPDRGEVSVALPGGTSLGDFELIGKAGADGERVFLETESRSFLLDVATVSLIEVFPSMPAELDNWPQYFGSTASDLIGYAFDYSVGAYRYYAVPWDGSQPEETNFADATAVVLEPWGLRAALRCPDDSSCQILRIEDADGNEVLPTPDLDSLTLISDLSIAEWGSGLLTVVAPPWQSSMVGEYDPDSGVSFLPLPAWVGSTGALARCTSVFAFSDAPGGG